MKAILNCLFVGTSLREAVKDIVLENKFDEANDINQLHCQRNENDKGEHYDKDKSNYLGVDNFLN